MKYDLKGHPRSYKTTFMPKSCYHICFWTDLLSLYASLSFLSLSHLLLSFSFPETPYRLPPYNGIITTLQPQPTKKFRGRTLAHCLSPPLSFSYSLSMPFYLFSVSRSSYTLLPYIGVISTLCLFIFSLSLVLLLSFFNLNLRSYGQLFVLVCNRFENWQDCRPLL